MSSDDFLVKVEGVSKKFCKELRRSLRYGLQDVASEMLLHKEPSAELRRHEFWALQDVNFELKRGESFGIIGVNGSGKTTLLKILQGLLKPTTGRIMVRGQVGALITLGQGFQPLLSGRENIYINAAILGIPRAEVQDKLEDILAFADLGDFIDTPVKNYSSGMKGRLGFSIATNLIVPDVLLLDEVMATGDWKFKERCFQRMEEIVNSGATIVFVSHLVPKVERLCNRAMLLHKGVVKTIGSASDVCEEYYSQPDSFDGRGARQRRRQFISAAKRAPGNGEGAMLDADEFNSEDPDGTFEDETDPIEIYSIQLLDDDHVETPKIKTLDALTVRVLFTSEQPLDQLKITVQLMTLGDEITIAGFEYDFPAEVQMPSEDKVTIDCRIPQVQLREGKYRVSVTIADADEDQRSTIFKASDLVRLAVERNAAIDSRSKKSPGMVYMPVTWEMGGSGASSAPLIDSLSQESETSELSDLAEGDSAHPSVQPMSSMGDRTGG
ncbi:MAG: ABC transporter ATP-binding protein [Elainellaceae cyanobacterium]